MMIGNVHVMPVHSDMGTRPKRPFENLQFIVIN